MSYIFEGIQNSDFRKYITVATRSLILYSPFLKESMRRFENLQASYADNIT